VNLEDINERFQSGNSIPVERATLKADEWKQIYVILKDLAYPKGERLSPEEYAQGLRFALELPDQSAGE
jgi:hypothetical protein